MTNEALQKKINLVMDKLIHLGGADYENCLLYTSRCV